MESFYKHKATIPPLNNVSIHKPTMILVAGLFEKGSGERRIKWPFGLYRGRRPQGMEYRQFRKTNFGTKHGLIPLWYILLHTTPITETTVKWTIWILHHSSSRHSLDTTRTVRFTAPSFIYNVISFAQLLLWLTPARGMHEHGKPPPKDTMLLLQG